MIVSTRITAATDFPVSIDEAKSHLRLDPSVGTAEDSLISGLIAAATGDLEEFTRRRFMAQTWEDHRDEFADEMVLEVSPVASVSSVSYVDPDGVVQTLDAAVYSVSAPAGDNPPRAIVRLAYGQSWPDTRAESGSVRIRYVAGYASAAAVPAPLRSAILLTLGHLYANREDVVVGTIASPLPRGAEALARPFRLWEFV